MTIVLKLQGKGTSRADSVSVHIFDKDSEAVKFCAGSRVEGKYWTTCWIVEDGEVVETINQD